MQIIGRWLLITLLCTIIVACGGNDEATLNTLEADTEGSVRFQLDAWADNWFAAYLGEELLVEDSVSITTERSFNAETVTFDADYPLNLNFILKDFKENDTGLEYIGSNRQQMGDGGFIMQLTDTSTGNVVAVSDDSFVCTVIHTAPLDKSCESESDPVAGAGACTFSDLGEPDGWMSAAYDDSAWTATTIHTSADVDPKQGYDEISWDSSAQFIWGPDLETNNTVLCRVTIEAPNTSASASASASTSTAACDAFMDNATTRCEGDTLYVESDGLPTTHNMMVGIVSWQQQVPLPQPYVGDNAWQIPLDPELSNNPISAANDLFRGAIALAVNGVPIFNALNNRGVDAYLAGELDEWGGHGGRGDDYHYHLAPTHLQPFVGVEQPIAYALDGFPLYGLTEPDGSPVVGLDEFNGHFDDDGNYHYHATETYPYINGGMRGVVGYRDGQVDPQPQAQPVRPAGEPLRGAEITAFSQTGTDAYSLQYTLNGETYTVNYTIAGDTYTFEFIDPTGHRTVETYTQGEGGGGAPQNGAGAPPPPQGGAGAPPPPQDGAGAPPPPQGGPDFAAAAAQLGISTQALMDALGPRPHDFKAAAATLGVSEEALQDALGPPPQN